MRWLLVLLAACSPEAAIAPNTCGNWVLEGSEDCDQPTGCTADCRVACDPAAPATCTESYDGLCCPDGASCGLDRACHLPTGRFATRELAAPLELVDFRAGDLDGDGRADVLGVDGTHVRAAYAASGFALPVDLAAPRTTGHYAIGDYDGDGRLDAVFPIAQGLAAVTTARAVPEPVVFPVTRTLNAIALGSEDGSLAAIIDTGGNVVIDDNSGTRPVCIEGLTASRVPLRTIHPYTDNGVDVVPVLFTAANPNVPGTVCISGYGADRVVGAPGGVRPTIGDVFFVPLAAGCADLYAPVDFGGLLGTARFRANGSPGACDVNITALESFVGSPLASLGGSLLVTTGGVSAASDDPDCEDGAGLCPVLTATRAWQRAAVGDFDGDGRADFVVGSDQPDLEVFFQTATGFTHRLIPTGGVPTDLAAGDFDGDGRADFAFAMPDPIDPTKSVIRFGFDLQLAPPVRVPKVAALAAFQAADPGLPPGTDHVDDLAIATTDGALTVMYGSADRGPIAPYQFASDFFTGTTEPASGTNVVIGGFAPDNQLGLLAVFAPSAAAQVGFSVVEYAQLAPQAGSFAVSQEGEGGGCTVGSFCPSTAVWVALPVAQGALALGFANAGDSQPDECGEFYLARGDSGPFPQGLGCNMLQGPAGIRHVERARYLGDGLLATAGDGEVWTTRVSFAGDQQPVLDDWQAMSVAVGAPAVCSDVALLELGTRDGYGVGRDLATACTVHGTTSIFAIFAAPASNPDPTPRIEKLFDVPTGGPLRLETGDIDGDGLTDLIYSDGAILRVRFQCDPHGGCT